MGGYVPKDHHWKTNIWTGERHQPNLKLRDDDVLVDDIEKLRQFVRNGVEVHAAWDWAAFTHDGRRHVFDYRWIGQLFDEGLLHQTFSGKAGQGYRLRRPDDPLQTSQVQNPMGFFTGLCTNPDCPACHGGHGKTCGRPPTKTVMMKPPKKEHDGAH